jgi:GDP/UDP-N,N'-diacetylbacillosamine 2-epimerase (hydrolysing)
MKASEIKLCIITGSRSEYGLLYPLIKKIKTDPEINLDFIATGSHLSPEHGMTVNDIEFPCEKIECILSSDSPIGVSKAMGLAMISFSEVYDRIKPDAIIILGDRFEIMAAAIAAHINRIPICHISGGEITKANYDDAFRHSITKMSQLHFTAAEPYRQRIIQMGEHPDRVFTVGALGLDGLFPRKDHENLGNIMVIYHPTTLVDEDYNELFSVLTELQQRKIFILSNADNGWSAIDYRIMKLAKVRSDIFYYQSLSRREFLNCLKWVDAIVGNSSCGIIEAPALGVPTINIGSRQEGRLRASSIIDCEMKKESIRKAFEKLYSKEFQESLKEIERPYGGGNVAQKIVEIIKRELPKVNMAKGFYDVRVNMREKNDSS